MHPMPFPCPKLVKDIGEKLILLIFAVSENIFIKIIRKKYLYMLAAY